MRQFLQILWLGMLCLIFNSLTQAQCPPMAGTDSLLCGFTTTLMASPEGGTWSIVCDESAGLVEFEDASNAETSVTVSECGTYTFIYTMNTIDCAAEDMVKIGFEDPSSNVITGSLDVGLEVDYGCPSSAEGCSTSLTIAGVNSPPVFNWSMGLIQECCPIVYETLTQTPFGTCEADIAVNVITSGECSVNEANWVGNQGDLVNVDSVIVSANFFDIYLPLLEGLEGCEAVIGGGCSFEDLPDVCQPDTTFLGYDTLIVNIPYATGAGQWHYVVNADSLLALQDTTQLPPPNDLMTLIIEPNANYIGPDSLTFSAWEKNVEGNLVPLFSQSLNLINKIQWVYQVDYAPDTLLIPIICGEEQDCNCGCTESGFFPAIDIPVPDLTCPPISLSFTPPDYYYIEWDYPSNVFCEGDGNVIPNVTVEGCNDDYLFSGSDGLSIDPITGEIFIDQSEIGTYEVYLSTSDGYFDVMVIDILPSEIMEFEFSSYELCAGYGFISPTITGGVIDGIWTINNGGIIDPNLGEIDLMNSEPGTYTVTYIPNSPCGIPTSQTIEIYPEIPLPSNLSWNVTENSIEWTWDDVPGDYYYDLFISIDSEDLISFSTEDTHFLLEGLAPGTMVIMDFYVLSEGYFCVSYAITTFTITLDCSTITPQFTNLSSSYCVDGEDIELTATPEGGIFVGEGVTGNIFSPSSTDVGTHLIDYHYTDPETGCSYTVSETITVNSAPTSYFELSAYEVCAGEIIPITLTYTGNAGSDATFDWYLEGSALSGMGPHTIDWSSNLGSDDISLQVSENGCGSDINVQFISVVEPISPVVINCSTSSADMVFFDWEEIIGAASYEISYTINGGNPMTSIIANSSFEVNGLNPEDEVTISVVALSNNFCGNSPSVSMTCNSQSCPVIDLELDNLEDVICSNTPSFPLTFINDEGIFYVNGNESFVFDPEALGEGQHLVEYVLIQGNCVYQTEKTVTIEAPIEAVNINCSNTDTDMVSFNWNEVLGYDFEVTYTVNGQNSISNIESSNTFEVDNLNPQDEVEISVTVLNNGICGNSETASQICTAQDCPTIELNMTSLANEYCSDYGIVALVANIGGGVFYVNGEESSVFEPAIMDEGIHLVEYILNQGNCTYSTEMNVAVENSIEAVNITCSNTDTDMVSFNWNEVLDYDFEVTFTINGENSISSIESSNTFEVDNLNPQDEVEISVTILNNGICGNSETVSQTCIAQNCPSIDLIINDLENQYCSNETATALAANIGGGIFYVNGNESSVFDPAILGEGIHLVEYILVQGNCSYSTEINISVENPIEAVNITCSNTDTDMVSFNWNEVVGYDFEVTYTVNGENPLTNTLNDNSLVVNNLNPADVVELTVLVLNDDVCGNSSTAIAMCTAQACDPIVLSIDNLADSYCSDEEMLTLEANIEGGTFYINSNESTVFDPAIIGAGSHLLEYILEQNGCMFDVQTTVDVIEPLEAVLVDCGEINDNSITFNWSESANAVEYQVVLSGAITDNFTQTTTTYTVENLTASDAVTIEVTAIGTTECANSETAMAACSIPLIQECLNLEELNQVLSFPTAFSPNEDGVNDDFRPAFPYAFSDYDLMIFNRWGKKVFGSRDVDFAWDGVQVNTFEDAALGVYVWHLKARVVNDCGEEIAVEGKGNVTLVR